MNNPVDIAAKRVGSLSALAKAIGISPPSVSRWRKRAAVPASRAVAVSNLTGLEPALLCPNVFACMSPCRREGSEPETTEQPPVSESKIAFVQHLDSSGQSGSHAETFRRTRNTTISPVPHPEEPIRCGRQTDVSDSIRFAAGAKAHD